jgi:hypothetical protein
MKPQDIDKIANVVASSLAGSRVPGLLGCGAISNAQDYELNECTDPSQPFFTCDNAGYECGGAGQFLCCEGFDCLSAFYCPGVEIFGCGNDREFNCLASFQCGAADTFNLTSGLCDLPPL